MAENLPFHDDVFDCATIGFALRNVTDIQEPSKKWFGVKNGEQGYLTGDLSTFKEIVW